MVEHLTAGERLKRGAAALGLGVAAAALALPIPIVHFVLVPGALLIGLVLGLHRVGQHQIFESAKGPCPFCATQQRLGLAGKSYRLPRRVHCQACGRELDLEPLP